MNVSKIAINGFFGRMGQTIYNLSIKDKEKFDVTVGCDQKDKINLQHEISLTDDLSKFSDLFDVVIDFHFQNHLSKQLKHAKKSQNLLQLVQQVLVTNKKNI